MKIKNEFLNKKILIWTNKSGFGDVCQTFISSQILNSHGLDTYTMVTDEKEHQDLFKVAADIKPYFYNPSAFSPDFKKDFDYTFCLEYKWNINKPMLMQFLENIATEIEIPLPGFKIKQKYLDFELPAMKNHIILMCYTHSRLQNRRRYLRHKELATALKYEGYEVLNLTDVDLSEFGLEMLIYLINNCRLLVHCDSSPYHSFSGLKTKKLMLFCHDLYSEKKIDQYANVVFTKEVEPKGICKIVNKIV